MNMIVVKIDFGIYSIYIIFAQIDSKRLKNLLFEVSLACENPPPTSDICQIMRYIVRFLYKRNLFSLCYL